ncbi:C-reactive protein 1.4-like [Panulirus ornatus]|uniref:C-reactive protein 1.4-like n=1 Tax=Panulirus ornatus TaxID=150431 RepID=UPI003A8A9372
MREGMCERLTVWLLLVLAVVVTTGSCDRLFFPQVQPCQGNKLPKLRLNQSGYVQYSVYDVDMPELSSFTMHYWFNLIDANRTATTFNYALDLAKNNNNLTVQLERGQPQHWTMQINDMLVSRVVSPLVEAGVWYHMLHSWNSATGQWSVFMNGKILATGHNSLSVGLKIPGGGIPASGQHQNTALFMGMDQGEGIEGWFTLFQMSSRPLHSPYSKATANTVEALASQCSRDLVCDIVSWRGTPRKGYGGVTETPGQEDCGDF